VDHIPHDKREYDHADDEQDPLDPLAPDGVFWRSSQKDL
jgi:hypothetical protein